MMVIKENGYVYIATDAWLRLCAGHADAEWYLNEENAPLCKIPNDDNIVAALIGPNASFLCDLLRYEPDSIRGELTLEKLILETAPDLRDFLKDCGKLSKTGSMRANIVFAQKDRAFIMTDNFHCSEVEDCEAFGRSENTLNAALYFSKGLPPEERFCACAKTLDEITGSNPFALYAINTQTCKPYLIERKG